MGLPRCLRDPMRNKGPLCNEEVSYGRQDDMQEACDKNELGTNKEQTQR